MKNTYVLKKALDSTAQNHILKSDNQFMSYKGGLCES